MTASSAGAALSRRPRLAADSSPTRTHRPPQGGRGDRPPMDVSTRRPRLRFVTFVIAAVVGTGLLPAPRAQAAPDFSALRRSAPYVPLFSETNNCTENKTVNNLSS